MYADQAEFYDALGPGAHENVAGTAYANIRTLLGLIPPDQIDDPLVAVRIPHEFVHLVFDTAAGNPYHAPPRWLNEGLAVYQSEGYGSSDRGQVEDAARSGHLIPLDGLSGQFPNGNDFFLAYAESVAAVDFMIKTYGKDALVTLIRSYAGGRTDDEAFTDALGVDTAAFTAAWFKDVNAKPPTAYGPQPEAARPGARRLGQRAHAGGAGGSVGAPGGQWRSAGRDARARSRGAGERTGRSRLGRARRASRDRRGRRRGPRRPTTPARRGHPAVTAVRRLRAIPSWQITLGLALLALGFLVAAQLASEVPRARYTTQERTPLVETADELQAQQDGLKARILELRVTDPGRRDPGRGVGRPRAPAQRPARAGAHRCRPHLADRHRDRHPAGGFEGAGPARRATNRPTSSGRTTSVRSSTSCGRRAPRRSR